MSDPAVIGDAQTTRRLLICGVIAGSIYIVVGVIEALTREGFDITRHALSLLSNGSMAGFISPTSYSPVC